MHLKQICKYNCEFAVGGMDNVVIRIIRGHILVKVKKNDRPTL